MERPGLPIVTFGLLLHAGATAAPAARPGLAHMTASLLSEGTSTRSSRQIANEMEFLGSHLGATASRENVLVSAETLTANWPVALEIVADVVQNPTFPAEEFERVRKEHLTDLSRIADNPVVIASRAARALLYGPESSHGHPVTGTEKSVQAMTRDEIVENYAALYSPQNTTLLVVGDVTESEVIARAEAYLGSWSAGDGSKEAAAAYVDAPAIDSTTIFMADKPGAAQSVIRAGHLTIPRSHPNYHPMSLLNYIFGGQFSARLNMNLRQDKGYSYGYSSSIDWSKGPSAMLAGGGVQTDVTKEAVAETFKEFSDVREKRPVTQEELDNAKDGILRSLPSQFETHAQTLHQLIRLLTFDLPDDYFSSFAAELSAVSLEEVHRVARELLHDGRLNVVVAGDREAVESGLRELGYPIVPVDYEGHRL